MRTEAKFYISNITAAPLMLILYFGSIPLCPTGERYQTAEVFHPCCVSQPRVVIRRVKSLVFPPNLLLHFTIINLTGAFRDVENLNPAMKRNKIIRKYIAKRPNAVVVVANT